MFQMVVEFPASVDSQELYKMVESYHLNVTDLEIGVFLYGNVTLHEIGKILTICAKFGMLDIHLYDIG